jgi:hypothetical protein
VQRWIKRSRFHLKRILRGALDVFGDGVAVGGAQAQRSEDQEIESPLE